MAYETLLTEISDSVLTVTMNRPERLNAFTTTMMNEWLALCDAIDGDDDVRAVIVTGAGRGFCAGADLGGGADTFDAGGSQASGVPRDGGGRVTLRLYDLTKPIIAAINGPAAGVGLVMACYADLRFAAKGAKLTTAHGKLNLPAEFGLSWLLPRLIGLTRAGELLLSSRVFLTDEAFELGLLNALLDADELLPYTYDYARRLADTVSPGSLRETKRQIYTDQHRDVGAAVRAAHALLERMMTEADYREAVAAFTEKRAARWSGG